MKAKANAEEKDKQERRETLSVYQTDNVKVTVKHNSKSTIRIYLMVLGSQNCGGKYEIQQSRLPRVQSMIHASLIVLLLCDLHQCFGKTTFLHV